LANARHRFLEARDRLSVSDADVALGLVVAEVLAGRDGDPASVRMRRARVKLSGARPELSA